jgi:5-methylcytosine-specific restriction endonuclease McrA
MCRSPAAFCTELGTDPSRWPQQAPLPTPDEARRAGRAVREAINLAHERETDACRAALQDLDQTWLQTWFIVHAQNASRFRRQAFHPTSVQTIPREDRDKPYPAVSMERMAFTRDNGHCRYCGVDVFLRQEQKMLSSLVGPALFAMGTTNLTRSGAMIVTRATADHVVPVSQGGKTTLSNLVTACWPCQFGKAEFTPDQLGLRDPRV